MADIMRDAQKRIEDIRRRTVKIVVRRDGSPVPDAQVELRMNRHQFLFGCALLLCEYIRYSGKRKTA